MAKLFKEGIDVSAFQGKIDWQKVKGSAVDFAMLRASSGFGGGDYIIDSRFNSNAYEALDAGIPIGAYHTTMVQSADEARRDAEHFLSTIQNARLDYPVALDFENRNFSKLPSYVLRDIAVAWCREVLRAGYHPLIKGRPTTLFEQLNLNSSGDIGYWVTYFKPQQPRENRATQMWQYASGAKIDGIEGYVNRNRSLPFQLYVEKQTEEPIEEPLIVAKEAPKTDVRRQAMDMIQILEVLQGMTAFSEKWGNMFSGGNAASIKKTLHDVEDLSQSGSVISTLYNLINSIPFKPDKKDIHDIQEAKATEEDDVVNETMESAIDEIPAEAIDPTIVEIVSTVTEDEVDDNILTISEADDEPDSARDNLPLAAEESVWQAEELSPEDDDFPPVGGGEDAQDLMDNDD